MKTKLKTRIAASVAAAAIAACTAAVPALAVDYEPSTIIQGQAFSSDYLQYWKYCEKLRYPAGKYWNDGNPESYTSSPCVNHNACNHFTIYNIYDSGYTSRLYSSRGGIQCAGYARKVAYDFYRGPMAWLRFRNPAGMTLRVGDQVRIGNDQHTVFVTQVNGNSLKVTDCNAGGTCVIRWDVSASYSTNTFNLGGTSYNMYYIDRPIMKGDVNGDSVVNWTDVNNIYYIYRGTYNYSGKCAGIIRETADLNNDGQITYADYYEAYSTASSCGYLTNERFVDALHFGV